MKDYPKAVFLPTNDYSVKEYEVLSVRKQNPEDQENNNLLVNLKNKESGEVIENKLSNAELTRFSGGYLVFSSHYDAKMHVMEKLEEQIKITKSQLENLKSKRDVLSYEF